MANLLGVDNTDILLISHGINRKLYLEVCDQMEKQEKQDYLTLFLTTYGGDPHAGYRIARCLGHHYKKVRLVVPYFCKSAGTLMAIGANELAIGDRGELGPLDIQVANPSEIFERSSGLDLTAALEYAVGHAQAVFRKQIIDLRKNAGISTRLAGDLAARLAVGLVEPLYGQIDPARLGETQRAMKVTHEYGSRLDETTDVLKPNALTKLVGGYPAHGFVIDRKEARDLFRKVDPPTEQESTFVSTFWNTFFKTESDQCIFLGKEEQEGDQNDERNPADQPPATPNAEGD